MVTVADSSSGHGRRRRAAGDAREGRRRSPEADGDLGGVGAAWCCLKQAGELNGALQTCSESRKMIGASSWHCEATGVILESVRSSGDPWMRVLLPEKGCWGRTGRSATFTGG